MRLGEILIAAHVITARQLEEALQAQVMLGARLGTSLVEHGYIDLDSLSNALAHQLRLPAALASHFDRADRVLQRGLSANLAEKYACLPLLRVGKRAAVIASISPLEARPIAIIADELGLEPDRLIQAVAPELRIRYSLEHVYNIPRPQRFLRAPGTARATPVKFVPSDTEVPILDEPPVRPSTATTDSRKQRHYVATLADTAADTSHIELDLDTDVEEIPDDDLPSAVAMIMAGSDREEVARLAITVTRHLDPFVDAALLMTIRGAVVVGSGTFRRDGEGAPEIALPLDQPSAVAYAVRSKSLVAVGAKDHTALDRRMLSALGIEGGQLVAAPLIIGTRVLATLVVASRRSVKVEVVETIAGAAAGGFARLVRELTEGNVRALEPLSRAAPSESP